MCTMPLGLLKVRSAQGLRVSTRVHRPHSSKKRGYALLDGSAHEPEKQRGQGPGELVEIPMDVRMASIGIRLPSFLMLPSSALS